MAWSGFQRLKWTLVNTTLPNTGCKLSFLWIIERKWRKPPKILVFYLYFLTSCKLFSYRKVHWSLFFLMSLSSAVVNPLNPELNPICYLLALLGAHHFLHVSKIKVKLLPFRLLMSYIYGAPILDVSRSHTTTQHSR